MKVAYLFILPHCLIAHTVYALYSAYSDTTDESKQEHWILFLPTADDPTSADPNYIRIYKHQDKQQQPRAFYNNQTRHGNHAQL